MPLIFAIIAAAVLGAVTFFFGGQFLPDANAVYFQGMGDMASQSITQLYAATGLAAFLGWSLGLLFARR